MTLSNNSMSSAPDDQELIKLTEFELRKLDDLRKEHGFTPWMLYLSFAALLWAAIDLTAKVTAWRTVGLYWAALVLFAGFVRDVLRWISIVPRDRKPGSRVYPLNRLLGSSRPRIVASTVIFAGMGWVVYDSGIFHGSLHLAWAISIAISLLASVIFMILSFTSLPFGLRGTQAGALTANFATASHISSLIAVAVFALMFFPVLGEIYAATEVKLACLCFGMGELVLFLLAHPAHNPLRNNLVELRRDLGLGETTGAEAKRRLESAIYGLRVTDYLQPSVSAILSAADDAEKRQQEISELLESCQRLASEPNPGSNYLVMQIALNEARDLQPECAKLIDRMPPLIAAFDIKANFAKTLYPALASEIEPFANLIEQRFKKSWPTRALRPNDATN